MSTSSEIMTKLSLYSMGFIALLPNVKFGERANFMLKFCDCVRALKIASLPGLLVSKIFKKRAPTAFYSLYTNAPSREFFGFRNSKIKERLAKMKIEKISTAEIL